MRLRRLSALLVASLAVFGQGWPASASADNVPQVEPRTLEAGDRARVSAHYCRPGKPVNLLVYRLVNAMGSLPVEVVLSLSSDDGRIPLPDAAGVFTWELAVPSDWPAGPYRLDVLCVLDWDASVPSFPSWIVIRGEYEDRFTDDEGSPHEAALNALFAWGILPDCLAQSAEKCAMPPLGVEPPACPSPRPGQSCVDGWMFRWEVAEYLLEAQFVFVEGVVRPFFAGVDVPFEEGGFDGVNTLAGLGIADGAGCDRPGSYCPFGRAKVGEAVDLLVRGWALDPADRASLLGLVAARAPATGDGCGIDEPTACLDDDLTIGQLASLIAEVLGIEDPAEISVCGLAEANAHAGGGRMVDLGMEPPYNPGWPTCPEETATTLATLTEPAAATGGASGAPAMVAVALLAGGLAVALVLVRRGRTSKRPD